MASPDGAHTYLASIGLICNPLRLSGIFQANRTVVETEKLSSLEVTVASTPLRRVPGSVFPIPGGVQYYHHITFGRRGGARHG